VHQVDISLHNYIKMRGQQNIKHKKDKRYLSALRIKKGANGRYYWSHAGRECLLGRQQYYLKKNFTYLLP